MGVSDGSGSRGKRLVVIKKPGKKNIFDPDVIRTRSLLIWSQTHYRCATESYCIDEKDFKDKKAKVLPRFELGSLDSKSRVLTITP